jgi:hypothetical protein
MRTIKTRTMKLFYQLPNQALFILVVAIVFGCQSSNTKSNLPSRIAYDSIDFRVEKQNTTYIVIRDNPELVEQFEITLEKIIQQKTKQLVFQKLKSNLVNDKMTPQQFVDFMKNYYRTIINLDAVVIWKNKLKNNNNLDTIKNTLNELRNQ